jgi:thiol-disulfide isomerase/thioredoxin
MLKQLPNLFVCAGLIAVTPAVIAADLGDPAPALKIAEWIKGQPVNLAAGKGKKIFVVEFWATWCPPCRASIPHLTELQKKFKDKDVVFVGVSDEKVDTVKKFVEKMADKMDYAVAVDDDRTTSKGYMEAYGINGIPHAFVVDKEGRIVWNGHPMADLEKTLEQLLAGKYDMTLAKKRGEAQQKLEQFYQLISSGDDEAKADKLAKELTVLDKELGGIMDDRKFDAEAIRKEVKFQTLARQYQQAVFQEKPAEEIEDLAKKVQAVAPKIFDAPQFKENVELQALFQRYYDTVTRKPDEAKAAELAKKLGATQCKTAGMLNEFAWTLLTDPKIKKRDLVLATKLAKTAYDGSEGKDPAIIDTYARALFDSGKVDEAIQYQKKALALAKEADLRKELEDNLKKYQEKAVAK